MAEECPHQFGYLSQRPRDGELPEGCMTCTKLLECMTFKPNVETATPQTKETSYVPFKKEAAKRKRRPKVSKQHAEATRETGKEAHLTTLKNESETVPLRQEILGCQLKVEALGMWDSLWSDSVRIDKKILSRWGQKVELVEVEASDGETIRMVRCQVKPMESEEKEVIQIPIRILRALEIRKGELVTVRPASNNWTFIQPSS